MLPNVFRPTVQCLAVGVAVFVVCGGSPSQGHEQSLAEPSVTVLNGAEDGAGARAFEDVSRAPGVRVFRGASDARKFEGVPREEPPAAAAEAEPPIVEADLEAAAGTDTIAALGRVKGSLIRVHRAGRGGEGLIRTYQVTPRQRGLAITHRAGTSNSANIVVHRTDGRSPSKITVHRAGRSSQSMIKVHRAGS